MDSYIPLGGTSIIQLVADGTQEITDKADQLIAEMLDHAEKRMRRRRWWGLVHPWLESPGIPSDEQIRRWNYYHEHHIYPCRADIHRLRDNWIDWANKLSSAAIRHLADGKDMSLSLDDYQKLVSPRIYVSYYL